MWRHFTILCTILKFVVSIESDGYYTIVGPSSIRSNSEYNVAVTSHGDLVKSQIKLIIEGSKNYVNSKEVTIEPNSTTLVQFKIDNILPGTYKLISEEVGGTTFINEKEIKFSAKVISIFIQTDKGMYKPGDTIKFRIVALDANLKPADLKNDLDIFITDGQSNRVKQWTKVQSTTGVFSSELVLSSAPVLGIWTITCKAFGETVSKDIEVAEYVLPKFEVTVDAYRHSTFKDGKITATIRSKYTYGKPVKGELTVSFTPTFFEGSFSPNLIARKTVPLDGKETVEVDLVTELGISKDQQYERDVIIEAIVEETLTGKKHNGTATVSLHKTNYKIRMTNEEESYKPGLPFKTWVTVQHYDGTPVRDKINKISIETVFDYKNPITKEYSMDDNGMIEIDTVIPAGIKKCYLNAKYLDAKYNYFSFSKKNSANDVYLQAKVKIKNPTVNNPVSVEVTCTKPMKYLTYQIIGRGNILISNTIKVLDQVNHTLSFEASFSMVPKATLIVYLITENGAIISDKSEIKFATEFENSVHLELSTKLAIPGEEIDIKITTNPDSYVALLGIDQSVKLLKQGNDLEKSKIFSELADYNIFVTGKLWTDFLDSGVFLMTNAGKKKITIPITTPKPIQSLYGNWPLIGGGGGIDHWNNLHGKISGGVGGGGARVLNGYDFIGGRGGGGGGGGGGWGNWGGGGGVGGGGWDNWGGGGGGGGGGLGRGSGGGGGGDGSGARILTDISNFQVTSSTVDNDDDEEGDTIRKSAINSKSHFKPTIIRKEFPETWIWENFNTNSSLDDAVVIHKKVPDTISSWVITAFAVNPITGFGMTKSPAHLKVFQSFFISTNLPYSIKRGEIVAIPIVIFNYMDQDVTADVTLDNTEQEFEFTEISNEINDQPQSKIELYQKQRITVNAYNGASLSFMIKPNKIGYITIKVTATSSMAGDAVEKQLLVVPEGLPQYKNEAFLVDLREKDTVKQEILLEIPENAVTNSTRVEVSVVGDVFGTTIKNLDKLIRQPYGCGEQNMMNFVPNIVVLKYLTNIDQLTPEIEAKTKKFMESGYQRELTYKHNDGSFSAFGKSDKSGSTWLTAFVARAFSQASKYIDIDDSIIDNALDWLSIKQTQHGNFPEVGTVSHKDMQGGSGSGIALSAYTLITFLENKEKRDKYKDTISKAVDYLVRNLSEEYSSDNYALALATYALQLAGHNTKNTYLRLLDSTASTDGGKKFWTKSILQSDIKNPHNSEPNSINVEMSAYALLAFIEAGLITDSIPIMKWLVTQRNSEGGFQSTQDTVVGLQALGKLGEKLYAKDINVQVVAKYNENADTRMNVTSENIFMFQQYLLPSTVRKVNIEASGHGLAIVSVSYKYNMNDNGAWPGFTLDPIVNRNSNQNILHLSVCTSYIPSGRDNSSNMAVMEVAFPSGFTVDLDTLPFLETFYGVKRVETKEGDTVVIMYFDNLDSNKVCPALTAYRTHKVANQKPAAVTVYDYYDNTKRSRKFYSVQQSTLCDICEGPECYNTCKAKADDEEISEISSKSITNSTLNN